MPLFFITMHLGVCIIRPIQILIMKKPKITLAITNQTTILFNSSSTINPLIMLQQSKMAITNYNIVNLFPECLSKSHKDLRRTNYMFTLLTLLSYLSHFLNRNILALERIKLQMHFINKIQDTSITVFQRSQRFDTIIRNSINAFNLNI